ncbi:hypothetical protein DFH06DRAFT_1322689 [Mycena polygramma]|nr:hypothetical protein DFH06DRAFT_1322689 [Mycena polygramma]
MSTTTENVASVDSDVATVPPNLFDGSPLSVFTPSPASSPLTDTSETSSSLANRGQSSATKRSASLSPGSLRALATSSPVASGDSESSLSSAHSPSPSTRVQHSATRRSATAGSQLPSALKRARTASQVSSESRTRPTPSVQFNLDSHEAEPQQRVVVVDADDELSDSPSTSSESFEPSDAGSDYEGGDADDHDADSSEEGATKRRKTSKATRPRKTRKASRRRKTPKGTPDKRCKTTSTVNSRVRGLVRDAVLAVHTLVTTVFCLLTNATKPPGSIQFCHVLARRTKDDILTRLEWWWQLPYWTLYIDTRVNIFPLMANWHLSMDAGDWALVPHHAIITAILVWTELVLSVDPTGYNKGKRFPIYKSYNQTKFDYYVLSLSEDHLDGVVICRYANPKANANEMEHHSHPYNKIDKLPSHIHPHFVIYAVGQKLAKLDDEMPGEQFDAFLDKLAATACFGHSSDNDSEGDDADDEVKTKNRGSLDSIIAIYKYWSSDKDVPKMGSGHEWRKHPSAPSEEAEEKEEEGAGNAAAEGAEKPQL